MPDAKIVVQVRNLKKYFELRKGLMGMFGEAPVVKAVDDVNFEIREGEILGLVGESGCGKTTAGRLLTRLEDPNDGFVFFMGRDIALLEGADLKVFRRNIQMVFQDPYESLSPRHTVLQTVMEPLINHGIGETAEERASMVMKALEDAGLAPAKEYLNRFPHELSGGQRQRVAIARSLVINPKVIVADEPVSMLDVSIRAGVLNLMLDLRDKYRIPYLFITHDIAVARYVSDRLAVMYLGRVVEIGVTDEVIFDPKHPYTQGLLLAVPVPDPDAKHVRTAIKGEIPSAAHVPLGCRFRPRCPKAFEACGWQGEDMADWLLSEEKVTDPNHPLSNHIDSIGFKEHVLEISIKPEGDAAKVAEYVGQKVASEKATRPMFQAIELVDKAPGDKAVSIRCSSATIPGPEVASLLFERLISTVEFKSKDHPMYGAILDVEKKGSDIVVTIGPEEKFETPAPKKGFQTKIDSTVAFLLDFVKHQRKSGYPELKGVRDISGDSAQRKVVAKCRPAKLSAREVAKRVGELVEKDFIPGLGQSKLADLFLPVEVDGGRVNVGVVGPPKTLEKAASEIKKYFEGKGSGRNWAAKGVSGVAVTHVRGPKDLVVTKFIRAEEPPLLDVGGGHRVACYLYKPVSPGR